MTNPTILQGFEWYLPADSTHWKTISQKADELKRFGFSGVWLPPAYKAAQGVNDVGYGTYDLYDLGEFNQKDTVPTKYGTKEEYLQAIRDLHAQEIEVYADIVVDHFMGADEEETVSAVKYSGDNRNQPISDEQEISAWTKFTFPGRGGTYNDYVWTWQNFSGVDYDARRHDHAIFNFADKGWDPEVDDENGNYDYLMGCNLDMENQETVEQLDKWGKWYQETTDVDGFRLDAVKHIQFDYFVDWLLHRQEEKQADMFVVGEYWSDELDKLVDYIDSSGNLINLFDVPLHFNLQQASNSMGAYDMRDIFKGTLAEERGDWAVTFVDNHDTQKGQSLESWVEGWFKAQAYALILLREAGTPVVFWGDLYGIPSQNVDPVGEDLTALLKIREQLAHGSQVDYFNGPDVVGWVRTGDYEHENSGLAVVLTNHTGGELEMTVSATHGEKVFVDLLKNNQAKIQLDDNGKGTFPVNDGSISVYVNEEVAEKIWAMLEN
ncbi:alpha-amylase [Enterococcus sp. HY326]|uniref:alpha-amylase n=1 Tax=Enterococcus sp. HY326 TaxID=2971265 RepID=UPI002240B3AC|nr:alpha-amylase [Enterococcus sp. HY326]